MRESKFRPQVRHGQGLFKGKARGPDLAVYRPYGSIGKRPPAVSGHLLVYLAFPVGAVNGLLLRLLDLADLKAGTPPFVYQLYYLRINPVDLFPDLVQIFRFHFRRTPFPLLPWTQQ